MNRIVLNTKQPVDEPAVIATATADPQLPPRFMTTTFRSFTNMFFIESTMPKLQTTWSHIFLRKC
ncbi:MAG: hypothetical protein ACYDH1_12365 [Anaerolineaceae bacterium]